MEKISKQSVVVNKQSVVSCLVNDLTELKAIRPQNDVLVTSREPIKDHIDMAI